MIINICNNLSVLKVKLVDGSKNGLCVKRYCTVGYLLKGWSRTSSNVVFRLPGCLQTEVLKNFFRDMYVVFFSANPGGSSEHSLVTITWVRRSDFKQQWIAFRICLSAKWHFGTTEEKDCARTSDIVITCAFLCSFQCVCIQSSRTTSRSDVPAEEQFGTRVQDRYCPAALSLCVLLLQRRNSWK